MCAFAAVCVVCAAVTKHNSPVLCGVCVRVCGSSGAAVVTDVVLSLSPSWPGWPTKSLSLSCACSFLPSLSLSKRRPPPLLHFCSMGATTVTTRERRAQAFFYLDSTATTTATNSGGLACVVQYSTGLFNWIKVHLLGAFFSMTEFLSP